MRYATAHHEAEMLATNGASRALLLDRATRHDDVSEYGAAQAFRDVAGHYPAEALAEATQ
ncbi:hypothetical protein [Nonomuraea gerenzanensis]|uniref:Uncharacterized protein n=1 Tax=Nonomuraea gerenzanensis TaxID=93944 RepID=A0A1M4BLA2_9ACTN|nr:hypothetical protein [Nonomuraea gerenzanensis]UBU10062.1 hypothetical protein LCN96_37675 [Nonomuraea gerenzanensis]SAP16313.1 hypothetical protein BN4615_P10976 [Nonomuraea gerenzanensis]